MLETYTFAVGPDYTIATFCRGDHSAVLDEWTGRTFAEFAAGMRAKGGYQYRQETWTMNGRTVTEHTWERCR